MASVNVALNSYPISSVYSGGNSAGSKRANARRGSAKKGVSKTERNSVEPRPQKVELTSLTETIRLAQQGDAAAFEQLYRQHHRRVYALCLRMLGDSVEAEDLTQEAFLQLFRKIHTFRGESAFSSWLHRLTANIVLMRFRKKRPVTLSLDEITRTDDNQGSPRHEIGGPDLRLTGVFDRFNLQKAVDELPDGYKAMFLLHDVHGYEHKEIAEMLGCSIGNSKSQLHKARKRLRELLRGAEIAGRLPRTPRYQCSRRSKSFLSTIS
jgi:RNA polymerase sigma-70 factor, ECF subfamily